jgi:hypothetical protein
MGSDSTTLMQIIKSPMQRDPRISSISRLSSNLVNADLTVRNHRLNVRGWRRICFLPLNPLLTPFDFSDSRRGPSATPYRKEYRYIVRIGCRIRSLINRCSSFTVLKLILYGCRKWARRQARPKNTGQGHRPSSPGVKGKLVLASPGGVLLRFQFS